LKRNEKLLTGGKAWFIRVFFKTNAILLSSKYRMTDFSCFYCILELKECRFTKK